jgi:hypothetical protein
VQCFNCGGLGHWRRCCPHPPMYLEKSTLRAMLAPANRS